MKNPFDVIIIGGSYAGLSAAMSLGRASRNVLIIDSGLPCNRQTPHAHNFITHDGETPHAIAQRALQQVRMYPTIQLLKDIAVDAKQSGQFFQVQTAAGENLLAKKLVFATGVKDNLPEIQGFGECWGISILHCPYCHGYEVRNQRTGLLGNGDIGYEWVKLISHWTSDLVLFTNGPSTLTDEQRRKIEERHVSIIEVPLDSIVHDQGYIQHVTLQNGELVSLQAMYARPVMTQHCPLPVQLGCELTEQNLLKTDALQKTTVKGVFAAGDNCNMARSLAIAVASGSFAGASLNKELIEEIF